MLHNLLHGFADLVLSPACLSCRGVIPTRSSDRMVCVTCWSRMKAIPPPRCGRCWTPFPAVQANVVAECRTCPSLRPALRFVRSAYVLDEYSRPLVHALKYQGWFGVARAMATRIAELSWPEEIRDEVQLVVPVPLSAVRLRERGYNQAARLADELARCSGYRAIPTALRRLRAARSQTTLHPTERRANVAGAFGVDSAIMPSLAGQHVLLVDDVWTTGATALACTAALLDGGARAVSVATFARALPELEANTRRAELARRGSHI